jgi:hypothetical protein
MSKEERAAIMKKHNDMPRMQKYREDFFKQLDELQRRK